MIVKMRLKHQHGIMEMVIFGEAHKHITLHLIFSFVSSIKSGRFDIEGRGRSVNVEDAMSCSERILILVVPIHHYAIGGVGNEIMARFLQRRLLLADEVHRCDVVDARPPLVLPARELPQVVLLRVARHLRRRFRHHEVSRYVSPIPLPVLLQP